MYRIDGSFEFDVTRTFAVCRSFWSEIFVCGDPHASNFSGSFEKKKVTTTAAVATIFIYGLVDIMESYVSIIIY